MTDRQTGHTPQQRAPGRPYFSAQGLDHLRRVLDQETRYGGAAQTAPGADMGRLLRAVQGGRLQPPTSTQGRGAWLTIAELEESVTAAGDLLGPAVRAAIAHPDDHDGISEDRFAALRRDVQGLDREIERVADDLVNAEDELSRLEHELARGQVHYDEERLKVRQLEDLVDDARHQAAWTHAYAKQLEAILEELEDLVPQKRREAILRKARGAAHRTTKHPYAPGEDGCRRCGKAGDDIAHVDREAHR